MTPKSAKLDRDECARALADDADPAVVPMPVRVRLPFERAARWVVLDARKLRGSKPAAQ